MGALTSSLSEMVVPGPASPATQDGGLAVSPPGEESLAGFTPDVGLGECAPLVAALATLARGPAVFTAETFAGGIFSRR